MNTLFQFEGKRKNIMRDASNLRGKTNKTGSPQYLADLQKIRKAYVQDVKENYPENMIPQSSAKVNPLGEFFKEGTRGGQKRQRSRGKGIPKTALPKTLALSIFMILPKEGDVKYKNEKTEFLRRNLLPKKPLQVLHILLGSTKGYHKQTKNASLLSKKTGVVSNTILQ